VTKWIPMVTFNIHFCVDTDGGLSVSTLMQLDLVECEENSNKNNGKIILDLESIKTLRFLLKTIESIYDLKKKKKYEEN
jgi:hypothetical protein